MELLQIKNLNFTYPCDNKKALNDVNFSIKKGELGLIVGVSGCGKTTLLRLLKKEIAPYGNQSGSIIFDTVSLTDPKTQIDASRIGFVGQNPDEQIVTDKVWSELAFGAENMGLKPDIIRKRVGEMANYFGIHSWYNKSTDELSGGQKQILNLASVMIMQPDLLLLDEPTSQLDPIAAADFILTLQKLNREFGITMLISEHRLEDIFPYADKIVILDSGKVLFDGNPKDSCQAMKEHPVFSGFPAAARIWHGLKSNNDCPISVKEGKAFIEKNYAPCADITTAEKVEDVSSPVIEAKNIWFRYTRDGDDILRGLGISVNQSEIFSILGGNGSGKTTFLNIIAGLDRPYKGKIRICGRNINEYKNNSLYRNCIAHLPQNQKAVFFKESVMEDFLELMTAIGIAPHEQSSKTESVINGLEISSLMDRHPYDLSGGEQQKCALAKILLTDPSILLLDEPTKGMDAYYKEKLGKFLLKLKSEGKTILIATHDVEFAARFSDRCALIFNGEILSAASPNEFFSDNYFYTTAASRISRGILKKAILCEEVIKLCKGKHSE